MRPLASFSGPWGGRLYDKAARPDDVVPETSAIALEAIH